VHLGEYTTENDAILLRGRIASAVERKENHCTATHRGGVMKPIHQLPKNKVKQFSHSLNTATCGLSRYRNLEGCSKAIN
jgi:hypothetical protein